MRGKGLSVGLKGLGDLCCDLLVTSSWAATNWNEKVLHSFGAAQTGKIPHPA